MDFVDKLQSGLTKAEVHGEFEDLHELLTISQQRRAELAHVLKTGLPVVNPETGLSLQKAFIELIPRFNSDQALSAHLVKELNEKNPTIANYLAEMSKQMTSMRDINTLILTVSMVIKLLESQIEADQMTEE